MARPDSAQVLRIPGRVVIGPTETFLGGAFPFGGTEIGKHRGLVLQPVGSPLPLAFEGLGGEIGEILERPSIWTLSMTLRGWDSDAVATLFAAGYEAGETSQRATWSAPDFTSGTRASSRGVSVLVVPDDEVAAPALLAYNAIPNWSADAQILFQRGAEFDLPIQFHLMRDTASRIFSLGILADLTAP